MPGRMTPAMPPYEPPRPSERVHEGARGVPGRRVHHEARRLVHDEQIVVLVDDGEVHGFRLDLRRPGRRNHESQPGPRLHDVVRPERLSVRGEMAALDQLLDIAPRQTAEVRDDPVGTGPAPAHRDGQLVDLARHFGGGVSHAGRTLRGRGGGRRISSRRTAVLIAASATLKVYQRQFPMPMSTKSTT